MYSGVHSAQLISGPAACDARPVPTLHSSIQAGSGSAVGRRTFRISTQPLKPTEFSHRQHVRCAIGAPARRACRCAKSSHPAVPAWAAQQDAGLEPSTSVSDTDLGILSLDVEYMHGRTTGGAAITAPAYVCIVNRHLDVVYKSYAKPNIPGLERSIGGVRLGDLGAAPALEQVLQDLRALIQGRRVVGHGINKDLAALGIDHPAALTYDTMSLPLFQNKAGNSKSLKKLALQHLGQNIQPKGQALLGTAWHDELVEKLVECTSGLHACCHIMRDVPAHPWPFTASEHLMWQQFCASRGRALHCIAVMMFLYACKAEFIFSH